ncbi:beta-lactamase/transpeptidase-like protein [Apodospora peruviana]|uniref:Beta-lactamase/transpeptidase-like protein n=1 Tax=Apodospora peruviana TaxID=516989 RepID=A0AAE0IKK4_9PEZI|nr:beta-lactamase/transpeptidase-like protein [Apodospora peruviana]
MAAEKIARLYETAIAEGLHPGVSLVAGDRNVTRTRQHALFQSFGKASQHPGREHEPFTAGSTIAAIASMSKLMTAVAVLKAKNAGVFQSLAADVPITLRMVLSCTSGHEYDWMSQDLAKWRALRNGIPWTSFAYSGGADWAGKAIEIVFSTTLEDFMYKHIWKLLGIESDPDMKDRVATLSPLTELGEPPAKDESNFDILFGGTDCLGGAVIFSTATAYYTFLSAVFDRDERLLTRSSSYTELFRPQLNDQLEQSFNDYLVRFAGMICCEAQPGRFEKGTIMWGGVPCCTWFMDFEGGVRGTAICQMPPPMHPVIVGGLHAKFQGGVLDIAGGN